jgi:endonuclease/exonuclease/phosphatase family metal-dependent hydrolase
VARVPRLRLATFNLLHGRCLADGSTDVALLRAAARTLDADIIGLQEADRLLARSGDVDQPAAVAEAVGAAHVRFVPTLCGLPDGGWRRVLDTDPPAERHQYGVALVSRYPLRQVRVRRFPPAPFGLPLLAPGRHVLVPVPDEPRAAIAAIADTPYGPITVVTSHLSFVPGWNVRQLRSIVDWVRDLPVPRLLLGDLNMPGPLPRQVSGWPQLARLATYPAARPAVQFDHILGSGIGPESVTAAEAHRLPISDHRALTVEVTPRSASAQAYSERHPAALLRDARAHRRRAHRVR